MRQLNSLAAFCCHEWKKLMYYKAIMNIWKSYIWTMKWRIIWRKIIAVIYATYAVAKRKPKKIQACTAFEPLTSAIPVQGWVKVVELVRYKPVKRWWWNYECKLFNHSKSHWASYLNGVKPVCLTKPRSKPLSLSRTLLSKHHFSRTVSLKHIT